MKRRVRVSAVQLPTVIEGTSFEAKQKRNLRVILDALKTAGIRKSDIVLLGEYANLHHRTWSSDLTEYRPDTIPGRFTTAVAGAAKQFRMNVVIPMFGVYKKKLSSYAVVINRRGKIVGCYAKTHPTVPEQAMGIKAGDEFPVYGLDCAKIGIMTCMDIEYPEVAQIYMLKGAEVLLFPHVQSSWGEIDWEIRYRSRAVDTGLPVVSACYGYPEGEWKSGMMIGRSSVIGRDGLVLADIGRAIGVLTHDIDLDTKRLTPFYFNENLDRTLAVTASRRPEIYKDLVSLQHKKKALRLVKVSSQKGTKSARKQKGK
jgi:predicted amidohydrolase